MTTPASNLNAISLLITRDEMKAINQLFGIRVDDTLDYSPNFGLRVTKIRPNRLAARLLKLSWCDRDIMFNTESNGLKVVWKSTHLRNEEDDGWRVREIDHIAQATLRAAELPREETTLVATCPSENIYVFFRDVMNRSIKITQPSVAFRVHVSKGIDRSE